LKQEFIDDAREKANAILFERMKILSENYIACKGKSELEKMSTHYLMMRIFALAHLADNIQ
jgi:hypothetical protein